MSQRRITILKFSVFALIGFIVFLFAVTMNTTKSEAQGVYAYRIKPVASLPATCLPGNGDVVYLTAGSGSPGCYTCTDTNTWRTCGTAGYQTIYSLQGTLTTGNPFKYHTVTWNAGTNVMTDEYSNITDTSSNINSAILDYAVNGTDEYILYKNGAWYSGGILQAGIAAFAPRNGVFIYCQDCNKDATCTGGGNGALAKRLNGAWVCN